MDQLFLVDVLGHFQRLHHMAQDAQVRQVVLEGIKPHLSNSLERADHVATRILARNGHIVDIGLAMPRDDILHIRSAI